MCELDGMQCILEYGGDVGKVGCMMVVEYFDQQIVIVINWLNLELNCVDYCLVFCCGNVWCVY